jgi:hypothetical protein
MACSGWPALWRRLASARSASAWKIHSSKEVSTTNATSDNIVSDLRTCMQRVAEVNHRNVSALWPPPTRSQKSKKGTALLPICPRLPAA